MNVIEGQVYVVGDNIDTDQIIPAQYLNLVPTIAEEYRELGRYALVGLPHADPPFVAEGAYQTEYPIVIGGRNFGCGSSREHAPVALGASGVKAVVAQSFARIFFRNSIATGEVYPVDSRDRLCDVFATGETARLDLDANVIERMTTGDRYALTPLGDARAVIDAGGIFAHARATGMIKT
jgi:3-isopropylmalate/(R)-2-methylmalate dehydratase small subunit